jgi:hypothetical protein
MAPSTIPYPDRGQGIVFSACCPSHPLNPQTSAAVLLSDSVWVETLSASQASVAADEYASQPGSPRVTLPEYTTIGLAGSYAVLQNVWHMRSLRLQ